MTENDHFLMLYDTDSIAEDVVFKSSNFGCLKSEHIDMNVNYTTLVGNIF